MSFGLLALSLLAQTGTSSVATNKTPRVVILPIYGKPARRGPSILDRRGLRAFKRSVEQSSRQRFEWRRWQIETPERTEEAVNREGGASKCVDAACYDRVARRVSATHWLAAQLVEDGPAGCAAVLVLQDVRANRRLDRMTRKVSPCVIDNLALAGRELGLAVADGPRAKSNVGVSLGGSDGLDVGLPDVPDVELVATATIVRKREGPPLDQALAVYKKKYFYAFKQEVDGAHLSFVARDGAVVGECALRKVAGAPISDDLETFCEGNYWEWAWLGVPVGALVSAGSFRGLTTGSAAGVLGFVFGAIAAGVSGALALILNEDAADPYEGEYWSPIYERARLIAEGNRRLRTALDLTEAEVESAGMRR